MASPSCLSVVVVMASVLSVMGGELGLELGERAVQGFREVVGVVPGHAQGGLTLSTLPWSPVGWTITPSSRMRSEIT